MDVTPLELDLDPFRGRAPRSSGVHLTEIRDWLYSRLPGVRQVQENPIWENAAAIGFAFEDAIAAALSTYLGLDLLRGIEMLSDGIWMTPDGIDPQTGELWEFKFTWASLTTSAPTQQWKWLVQVKSYLHALGPSLQGEYTVNLVAAYACGTYRPPAPRLVPLRFTFTSEEIAQNWAMILQARDAMLREHEQRGEV